MAYGERILIYLIYACPQEASETQRLKAEETAREDAEQKDAEQI